MLMNAASTAVIAPQLAMVSGGTFWMGAQASDPGGTNYHKDAITDREAPVHRVTVPDFEIARCPTTVREFSPYARQFAGARYGVFGRRHIVELVGPSRTPRVREEMHLVMRGPAPDLKSMRSVKLGDPSVNWSDFNGGFTSPVEIVPEPGWLMQYGKPFVASDAAVTGVSWYMVQAFVEWLRAGLEDPRYTLLPEAWIERAMRGNGGIFTHGTQTGEISPELAVYGRDTITSVATKPGINWNGQEVHDLAGLVWEWASDWFAAYQSGDQHDPHGPETGIAKVLRGGSWDLNAKRARSAGRDVDGPGGRYYNVGFRVGRRV